jgi:hypothetical protein
VIELKREPEDLIGSSVQEEVVARRKDSKSRDRWVMDSGWAFFSLLILNGYVVLD